MPRRILRVSRKSIRKSRKLVRKSRKSVRKSRSNTKARVGGGKDSSVDYSTIKEKVIKFPFRDDLHLTLVCDSTTTQAVAQIPKPNGPYSTSIFIADNIGPKLVPISITSSLPDVSRLPLVNIELIDGRL